MSDDRPSDKADGWDALLADLERRKREARAMG